MTQPTDTWPDQITDGNGDVWKPAPCPGRSGEPTYYNSTGPDNWALTPTEIREHYGPTQA